MADDSNRAVLHCAHLYAPESIRCTRCGAIDPSRITHGHDNVQLGEAAAEPDIGKRGH